MQTNKKHETTGPRSTWPTIRIQLARPGESEDSVFVQMERYCPMARGQRCLVLAPRHDAVDLFLAELVERIDKLNPQVDVRLARVDALDSTTKTQALTDEAQRKAGEGGHVAVVLESLNALLAQDTRLLESCKRLFGSAKATEGGGTVTVVAVATEPPITDSDREVLRQFKGTGNMEVALQLGKTERSLSVDPTRSGTKHSEMIEAIR